MNAANRIWYIPGQPHFKRFIPIAREENLLKDRLIQGGWYRSEIAMLHKQLDTTSIYISSLIRRPFNPTSEHHNCTDECCVAHQINDETYQTRHADDCPDESKCSDVFADEEKVCRILENGGIPLIFYSGSRDDGSSCKLRVIDYNSNTLPFIAFSHGWAHGLGNTKANALPFCQLSQLKDLASKLSSISRHYQ